MDEREKVSYDEDVIGWFCKFARYNKFEEWGRLRNRDLFSSANVMCALSFDRDEDHIAVGGVLKKIKIFDLNAISSDSVDI